MAAGGSYDSWRLQERQLALAGVEVEDWAVLAKLDVGIGRMSVAVAHPSLLVDDSSTVDAGGIRSWEMVHVELHPLPF